MLKYVRYTAIHSFATSCSFTISTHSMLSSIGMNSSSLNMSINYISKDIIGQSTGLIYNWKYGKNADSKPLKHARLGCAIQQTSCILETFSPFIPINYLIPFLGITSTMKNISFIKLGSVNARNLQILSKDLGGIGHIYSKIASINTISSSLGMIMGLFLIYKIPSPEQRMIICLPLLTMLSLYCIDKSVKVVERGK